MSFIVKLAILVALCICWVVACNLFGIPYWAMMIGSGFIGLLVAEIPGDSE